jgi:hypothetical protein
MKIVEIQIEIKPDGERETDKDLQPKSISMKDNVWKLPYMFPRDIRFVAALEELVQTYNGRNK